MRTLTLFLLFAADLFVSTVAVAQQPLTLPQLFGDDAIQLNERIDSKWQELESERNGDNLILEWKTPDELPFPMPLDVLVHNEIKVLSMKDGHGELAVSSDSHVTFDPRSKILRQSDAIDHFQAWQEKQKEEDE